MSVLTHGQHVPCNACVQYRYLDCVRTAAIARSDIFSSEVKCRLPAHAL
jgi:hypothetical protein